MSKASDATIEFLKRKGQLPADYSLVPDYGGPKTTLERIHEFFVDAPGNLTGELIPKVNPYGRLNELERRQVDATRAAMEQEALEGLVKANQQKADEANQTSIDRVREQEALDLDTSIDRQIDMLNRTGDIYSRLQREAGDISTEQSIKQMQALYPYLDRAGQKAIERNLDASMRFKAFKEQLPSSIQAIMESKQRQQQLASDAFAREAGAIATQQQAATGFAGLGTGRYSGRRIA